MHRNVAYQGEAGAFGEAACLAFLPGFTPHPLESFAAVIAAVAAGDFERGVVPVANSSAGPVPNVEAMLRGAEVVIVDRCALPVTIHCLGLPGASLDDIALVRSHPMAIRECRRFLKQRGVDCEESRNTAMAAAKLAAGKDRRTAVLASQRAADIYGLAILQRDVHDSPDNATTFAIIARDQ